MRSGLGTLLGFVCVLGLLGFYASRVERDDDPRLYFEVAGKTLGRPADEAYLRMKRDGTPMSVPLPAPGATLAQSGRMALPYRDFAVEYPPLALGIFVAPRVFTDDLRQYLYAYQGMMAGTILGTALLLARTLQRVRPEVREPYGLAFWLTVAVLVLAGSFVVRRFDVLVSLTVAASVVSMLGASPLAAGLWLGAGAAAKLWPVMLLPLLMMHDRRPVAIWRLLMGFAVVPAVSHLVLYPWAGTAVVSYLGFHAGRGLQLESLWASVLMVVSSVMHVPVEMSFDHGSANLVMPGMPRAVSVMLWMSFAVGLAALGACYTLGYWIHRKSPARERARHLVEATLLLVACMVVTAKVFSPQYLFWLFPLAVALPDRRVGVLYLAAVGLTHLYYPYRYDEVMDLRGWAVLVRNLVMLGMVGVTFMALTRGWWATRGRAVSVERVPMEEG